MTTTAWAKQHIGVATIVDARGMEWTLVGVDARRRRAVVRNHDGVIKCVSCDWFASRWLAEELRQRHYAW